MPLVKVDASFVLLKAADVSTYTAVVLPAYMPTYLPPYLLHTCLDKYPHAYQNKHTCTDIQSKPLLGKRGYRHVAVTLGINPPLYIAQINSGSYHRRPGGATATVPS